MKNIQPLALVKCPTELGPHTIYQYIVASPVIDFNVPKSKFCVFPIIIKP